MQLLKTRLSWLVLPLLVLSLAGHWVVTGDELALRSNLDLPVRAQGVSPEEDEDAPDVIIFYGQAYEADSVVFCLDASLSMANDGRWALQKREIKRAITELSSDSEFGIVFYGADSYKFRETLIPATENNKQLALGFVDSRELTLGTCLGPGVVKALKLMNRARHEHRMVIVAGDGKPTPCPFKLEDGPTQTRFDKVIAESVSANPGLWVQIHTIFLGPPSDAESIAFMRRLAAVHRGIFRLVSG